MCTVHAGRCYAKNTSWHSSEGSDNCGIGQDSAGDSPDTTENQSDNQMLSVAGPGNQELISGSQCFSPSSSHFTTAIIYQHFLSSNGCATNTVIPRYISFPAILSAPGADHSPSNQAAFMQIVHSPFLVQQQQQFQWLHYLFSSLSCALWCHPIPHIVFPSHKSMLLLFQFLQLFHIQPMVFQQAMSHKSYRMQVT